MLKRGIHGRNSENCIALVLLSNCVNSGMVTANPASATSIERERAKGALRSEPVASTSNPPRIGIQIARLRNGIPVIVTFRSVRPKPARVYRYSQVVPPVQTRLNQKVRR